MKKIVFNAPRACFIFNSSLELYELRRLFPSRLGPRLFPIKYSIISDRIRKCAEMGASSVARFPEFPSMQLKIK